MQSICFDKTPIKCDEMRDETTAVGSVAAGSLFTQAPVNFTKYIIV
jgi:hypothetical protein